METVWVASSLPPQLDAVRVTYSVPATVQVKAVVSLRLWTMWAAT
jgi:hypothetical protein